MKMTDEETKIAKYIAYLQERLYCVVATPFSMDYDVDVKTEEYIDNVLTYDRIYSRYEIEKLLSNEKLTDNSIRSDITNMLKCFPQEQGKPEGILL